MHRFLRFAGAALFLGGALLVLEGCASVRPPEGRGGDGRGARVIPGVPFLPQEEDTCGPSSLAMLLRFHGVNVTTGEIVSETRTAGLRGTLITDLAAAARRRGLHAEVADLDMAEVRRRVGEGEPVILLVDLGAWVWSRPHYLLVYGTAPEGVVAHSGRTEGAILPFDRLDAQWAKMGRLSIVITGAAK